MAVRLSPPAFILPILSFVLLATACAAPPEADIVASVTTGQAPLTVTFTNASKNAHEFEWDFGDGASATTGSVDEELAHEYTQAGTHIVTLKAIQRGEPPDTAQATLSITIEPGPLHSVALKPAHQTLAVTKEQLFNATAFDQFHNAIPGQSYVFRSDELAGQMDSKGNFTAGTKADTYESGVSVEVTQGAIAKTAAATVVILPGPMDHVNIEPDAPAIEVGANQSFAAKALDRFGNTISGASFTWSVEDAGEIDSSGNFTAGTVATTYEDALGVEAVLGAIAKNAVATLKIEPGLLDHIMVEPQSIELAIGDAQSFSAIGSDQFGNEIQDLTLDWSVATEVGAVDAEGVFTAGTRASTFLDAVQVVGHQDDVSRSGLATVVIRPGPLETLFITPETATLTVRGTHQFSATAVDQYGNETTNVSLAWSAAAVSGSINASGKFTASSTAGLYEDSVTVQAVQVITRKEASATVTLEPGALDRLSVRPGSAILAIGDSTELSATPLDRYGNEIPGLPISYTLPEAARDSTVNHSGLFVAGTKAGTFEIEYSAVQQDISKTVSTTVTVLPDPVDRLELSPGDLTLAVDEQQAFTVKAFDQYGNEIPHAYIGWSVENQGGTIDENGVFTAGTRSGDFPDTVGVRVTYKDVTKQEVVTISVQPGPLATLAIEALSSVRTSEGMAVQFEAAAFDQFENEIPDVTLAWDATGGNVDADGLFTTEIIEGSGSVNATAEHEGNTESKALNFFLGFNLRSTLIAEVQLPGQFKADAATCRDEDGVQLCSVDYGPSGSQNVEETYGVRSSVFFYPVGTDVQRLFYGPQLAEWAKDQLDIREVDTVEVTEFAVPPIGEQSRGYKLAVTSERQSDFTAHAVMFRSSQVLA